MRFIDRSDKLLNEIYTLVNTELEGENSEFPPCLFFCSLSNRTVILENKKEEF